MEWMNGKELMDTVDGGNWVDGVDAPMNSIDEVDGTEWIDGMERFDKVGGFGEVDGLNGVDWVD